MAEGILLIGADGVWSAMRALGGFSSRSRFSGELAWRATIRADSAAGKAFAAIAATDCITTFLHPGFHRCGQAPADHDFQTIRSHGSGALFIDRCWWQSGAKRGAAQTPDGAANGPSGGRGIGWAARAQSFPAPPG